MNNGRRVTPSRTRAKGGVAAKELQAARRKKRHMEVIRNRIIFAAAIAVILLLIIFVISKIIGAIIGAGQMPETSTLTFNSDGTVTFEEVVDFDTDTYSKSDLEDSTEELIESFNEAYGDEVITLDKIKVSGDTAYLKTTYADASTYASFTTYDCYCDTVENAIDTGYDFSEIFAEVTDGEKGSTVDVDYTTDFAGYNVAIVDENVNVVVPGTINYISNTSTDVISEDTAVVSQADGNTDVTDIVYIIYTETTEN